MPEPDAEGNRPALEAIRTTIARGIIVDRLDRGWTQRDLAERAGVSVETISRLEGGKHKPQPATLEKIERAFEKT